jgi:hypothetical protein
MDVNVGAPYLFRSYDHRSAHPPDPVERNPGAAHSIPMGDVARATSAAPTYFDNIIIHSRKFGDGGFGTNNPAFELMREVGQMHRNDNTVIEVLLSIGTGQPQPISTIAKTTTMELYTYIRAAKKLATNSQMVHENMLGEKSNHNLPYHRLNVPAREGLGEMKLDEWKKRGGIKRRPEARTTLAKIRKATEAYLGCDEVIQEMTGIAETLVKRRRARSDTPLWGMVSTGLQYCCTYPKCSKGMKLRNCPDNLRKHLIMKHDLGDETEEETRRLEGWIEAGKLPY